MTLSAINMPSIGAYQAANQVDSTGTDTLIDTKNNTSTGVFQPNTSNNTGLLTQNVLETLQNVGFNVGQLSENENGAVQNFVQSLYQSLMPRVLDNSVASQSDSNSILDSTFVSGGTNFKYTIDFSDASLGDSLPDVKANLQKALDNIGQYIRSDAVFNLKVSGKYKDSNVLAETDSTMTQATLHEKQSIDTSFVSDSLYQYELNPNSADASLVINLARIGDMSFSGKPAPDKFDLTSILTHEVLHGLAFTGTIGNVNTNLRTKYDDLVSIQDGLPFFVGENAKKANLGNPVPLASAKSGYGSAYYHVAIPSDLMSESIQKGEVKTISPLDVAMLEDIGISLVNNGNEIPSVAKTQNGYNNSSVGLKGLIGTIKQNNDLQTNFDNLAKVFGHKFTSSSAVNLPDFLTQLAANIESNTSFHSAVGSLISLSA
ncbi:MAG: hypothetical protein NTZ45_11750 [Methylococcales bacterium]|nr:hypothetical protein [Methylococcales bacterium]